MSGYLYLIIGPMFAGKSSKLIRLIRAYKSKNVSILAIKHASDTRYDSVNNICSHDKITEPCLSSDNLIKYFDTNEYKNAEIIVIEEAQFFTDIVQFCSQAVDIDNKYLIVTGLSGDHKRRVFGQILNLIPLANKIDHLEAFCNLCNDIVPAPFTIKMLGTDDIVEIGDSKLYNPVCRKHYLENLKSGIYSI